MPQPLCPWERAPAPILLKDGWESGQIYTGVETKPLGTTEFEPGTVQPIAMLY
jgi:hypothetical protein